MTKFDEMNATAFQIIAAVGSARSNYIEAIQLAKGGRFREARTSIEAGDAAYIEGHNAHMGLIQREAAGDPTPMNLILTHAEDQLMSAEGFGILANELTELCEKVIAPADGSRAADE